MVKRFGLAAAIGVSLWFSALTIAAPAQDRPGMVTEPRVTVTNRGRSEAIPVSIQEWISTERPATVTVVGPVSVTGPVSLSPETVGQLRQAHPWQYRTVVVPAGQDAAQALATLGSGGWEAVGFQTRAAGELVVLMKRPS